MIINGSSRSNGAFFSRHLMRADQNERVAVVDMRGLAYADDVPTAFREMKELAAGTQCKNYFYHANLNTRADEQLTPEQWAQAVDALEGALQLEGQPRFIVEHEKEGRTHRHVIWGRIDSDTNTAISDSHNYRTHEEVAASLEEAFGHEATVRALTRDKDTTPRPEPNMQDWESFRAAESKIDPKAMKAELTELWQHSDSGPAFAAALEERGYILARGDRRDFVVVDAAGDEHSLGRRLSGIKAAEVRARMADIDATALPSVEEGRELARQRQEEQPQDSSAPAAQTPLSSP
ncbi:relaxase/mobilization nuclease domain-containing protein [Paeniroseomonas aquatica]|uniref:relaxase/mobilization nuclease domain-containing protein n=1 Tax=Paeniroseomonas aquatica TaxID=373043 RepID=UPI0036079DD3